MWNYFRLENEHLYNVGKFRAVRDISIGPYKGNKYDEPKAAIHLMDCTNDNDDERTTYSDR